MKKTRNEGLNVAMVMLMHGQNDEDLAEKLGVSVRTIRRYKKKIALARVKVCLFACGNLD